jgi:hypothetical protein
MAYSIDYDSSHLKEINKFRKANGLQPLKKEYKLCLGCGKKFVGFGSHHRMCDRCKIRDIG